MRVQADGEGAGRALVGVLAIAVAVVDREYSVHDRGELLAGQVRHGVGHERGAPPLHRIRQASGPPFAELLVDALQNVRSSASPAVAVSGSVIPVSKVR